MYSQSLYKQEKKNGRDDQDYNGCDDQEYNGCDDQDYNNGREDWNYNDNNTDRYGYNDHYERNNNVPVSLPVTYTHVPIISTPQTPTIIKNYRAASYDKYDKIFASQMQNFDLPQEFINFTNGLMNETEISRTCLLEAIVDYNKTNFPHLPEAFQKAAEHCRKYRVVKYDIHDQTYAKQMQFYNLPQEFSDFTEGLLKETHINRLELLEAINNYNAKGLPQLPYVFQDVAFNCRPYQLCVIC